MEIETLRDDEMINHASSSSAEGKINGRVNIKLLGIFRRAYGSDTIRVKIEKNIQLRELIEELVDSSEDLRRVLIDPELETPLPNAVILLNGKDISVLNGLETPIKDGDEIVLIPVIHGG